MIQVEAYLTALGIPTPKRRGGQELIVGEIVGALASAGCRRVYLPFATTFLVAALERAKVAVVPSAPVRRGIPISRWGREFEDDLTEAEAQELFQVPPCDGLYFGTPTIVDGRPLFPDSVAGRGGWTAAGERTVVRALVRNAKAAGCRRVVSGLGSGDISVAERCADLGPGAEVVAWKKFRAESGEGFTDWVIARDLR